MSGNGSETIEIIPLALKKMARRGIAEAWVTEAVRHPEQVIAGHGGRKVAHKRVTLQGKEGLLRVVYEEIGTVLVVVTAYYTSDLAR